MSSLLLDISYIKILILTHFHIYFCSLINHAWQHSCVSLNLSLTCSKCQICSTSVLEMTM